MKRIPYLLLLNFVVISLSQNTAAQFYYQDIITHQKNLQQYQLQKNNRVQAISISSYEQNGEVSADFRFNQQYNASWSQLKTVAELTNTGRNVVVNYYNSQGLLYRTTDSSNGTYSVYEYIYDSLARLIQIQNNTLSIAGKNKSAETHNWYYDQNGIPEKMERIRDKSDTMIFILTKDSAGNIIEEQGFYKGAAGEKTYYYYDSANRLTDIARYNNRAGKLLPDYMFDYDQSGRIRQMVSTQQGSNATIWEYQYDEQGLKTTETCYLEQKKLAGRMAYQYTFKK
jgi:hypothetical protein